MSYFSLYLKVGLKGKLQSKILSYDLTDFFPNNGESPIEVEIWTERWREQFQMFMISRNLFVIGDLL